MQVSDVRTISVIAMTIKGLQNLIAKAKEMEYMISLVVVKRKR